MQPSRRPARTRLSSPALQPPSLKDSALTRRLSLIALTTVLTFLVTVGAATAQTAAQRADGDDTACWKILTNDAFDGTVDGIYPLGTYSEAVSHLPTDVQSYSTISDVINRARQDALQKQGEGVEADPERCGFAVGQTGSAGGSGGGNGDGKGPIPGLIDAGGSDSADGFPVALIAIAAVAGVLVLGGGAGFLVRRRQRSQAELDAASGAAGTGLGPAGPHELGP